MVFLLLRPLIIFSSPSWHHHHPFSHSHPKHLNHNRSLRRFSCSSSSRQPVIKEETETDSRPEYKKPGILDELFLNMFRNKMVQEVGWDSEKPGFDGLIEVANRLMIGRSNFETKEAAVRILRSMFPPLLLELYRMLIAPLGGGRVVAIMIARVTALTCQWLMGPCTVNSVDLPDGTSWKSGVFVERCKYLEESKCVGICINTCKLPTQAFFTDDMGVPLLMEPNFSDYSCQFRFGVLLPLPEDDNSLKEPCLEMCSNANRRREISSNINNASKCPKAQEFLSVMLLFPYSTKILSFLYFHCVKITEFL